MVPSQTGKSQMPWTQMQTHTVLSQILAFAPFADNSVDDLFCLWHKEPNLWNLFFKKTSWKDSTDHRLSSTWYELRLKELCSISAQKSCMDFSLHSVVSALSLYTQISVFPKCHDIMYHRWSKDINPLQSCVKNILSYKSLSCKSTCNSSLSSPMMAAFFQSITSEKGSSQPLLRIKGTQAACEERGVKDKESELKNQFVVLGEWSQY